MILMWYLNGVLGCCGDLGNTQILVAVYGPKAGTKKNEDPERASFEVIWKPKSGQIGMRDNLWIL